MVYRSRYNRRYKRKRQPQSGWRNMKLGTLARKAYSGVRMLKGIVNAEKKTFDLDVALTAFASTTPVLTLLSGIAQGDDYTAREGRSILAKTLQLKVIVLGNSAQTADQFVRVILFKDMNNVGTAPTSSDIISTYDDLRNPDPVMMKRYQILVDQSYKLNVNGNTSYELDRFINLNCHMKFSGTGATNVGENAVYLILASSTATNASSYLVHSRLRYYDN